MVIIFIGILLIPSLFFLVLGLGTTILGWLANPKIMLALVITLGLMSLPGIIIGWIAKK
jgi:hypothetical protein